MGGDGRCGDDQKRGGEGGVGLFRSLAVVFLICYGLFSTHFPPSLFSLLET